MKEKIEEIYSNSLLACSNENNIDACSYALLKNKDIYMISNNNYNFIRKISDEEYKEVIDLINDLDLIGPFEFVTKKVTSLYNIYVNYKGINKKICSFFGTDEEPNIYNHVEDLLKSLVNIK